jgi:hypothetical protein
MATSEVQVESVDETKNKSDIPVEPGEVTLAGSAVEFQLTYFSLIRTPRYFFCGVKKPLR